MSKRMMAKWNEEATHINCKFEIPNDGAFVLECVAITISIISEKLEVPVEEILADVVRIIQLNKQTEV